ncbi:MAG: TRAP transporter permease [Firmicutes bacterium]|nr:TRAP transporter permease [Bacillota bacterium]
MREDNRTLRWIIAVLAVSLAVFHLYTAAFGTYTVQLQRTLHFAFAGVLGFLLYPARKDRKTGWFDLILACTAAFCYGYLVTQYQEMAVRQTFVTHLSTLDLVVGGLAIVLLLELTRRAVGWVLAAVALAALVYSLFGPYFPDILAHRGFSLVDVIDYQIFGLDGVFSIPMGISATYIVLFILLGTFMEFCGAGDVIMDIGKLVAGRFRGGPAKVACISSGLFGSISGSAAANVYATGTFSIPMMKKIGYKGPFAGAVEAVASTGGQIMPPVMGAAAFLMAELLGIPYIQVCKASLIPALIYFTSLFFVLDFEAAKAGIKGLDRDQIPRAREVLPRLYLLAPLVILVIVLIQGYTPFRAAFLATLAIIALSFVRKDTRFTLKTFVQALVVSARRTTMIAVACGAAGIVIGAITLTGAGLSLSSIIIHLSGGNMIMALLLIMVSSIIMGMGTPTTVAYVVVATLAVPVMKDLGYPALASHLFVFYFAVLSMITPPVALAAYAAAEIAKEDSMKIGLTAMKIGGIVFTVPFVFLLDPALLMQGSWLVIGGRTIAALVAILAFAGAATGWFVKRLGFFERLVFLLAFALIIVPESQTTLLGIGIVVLMGFLASRSRGRATGPARATH